MIERIIWGTSPDGVPIHRYTLRDGGVEVVLTDFGATFVAIRAPDRDGTLGDILLGLGGVEDYLRSAAGPGWYYPGSTVGRFANRIAGAAFTIDGTPFRLAANEGRNQLHGGPRGFDRAIWSSARLPGDAGVRFTHHSPAGDQGFPGALNMALEVSLRPSATVALRYEATSDAPTHVNLTSHAYFNLSGAPTIEDHLLSVAADQYLPIDEAALPLGKPVPVAGTPFDLRRARRVGDALAEPHPQLAVGDGFNHCLVLSPGDDLRHAATLAAPACGRTLALWTTEPGVQLYTGNALAAPFRRRQGLCLETQHFPDSPNRPGFPTTLLRPGETFRSETELRLGVSA